MHYQYPRLIIWQQDWPQACKNCFFKCERFMLYQRKDNMVNNQKLGQSDRELLTILTKHVIRTTLWGNFFNMCVRKVLLYGSKTWQVLNEYVQQLVTADSDTIRWMCGVFLKDCIWMTDLLWHLGLSSIKDMLCWDWLRFHALYWWQMTKRLTT